MTHYIRDGFTKLGIVITDKTMADVERLMVTFEVRGTHPLALNSLLLAVYNLVFSDSERQQMFDIFDTSERQVHNITKTIPVIHQDRNVSSDPFNLFCVWVIHLAFAHIKDRTTRETFQYHVAKILIYKFFTSIVNKYFQHGAQKHIMEATIAALSRKYDLVSYGTWKRNIEAQCLDLISVHSVHYERLVNADNDDKFLYIVTDTQNRIREKIKNITARYYETKENGGAIITDSIVKVADGQNFLVESSSTFDMVVSNMAREVLSSALFVDDVLVAKVAKEFNNISRNMLHSALTMICATAEQQAAAHTLDVVRADRHTVGKTVYVGIRALITKIVQQSFRYCVINKVPINNKFEMYRRLKNVYSSSRVSDVEIIRIKDSMIYLVNSLGESPRETTKSSLRLAILLYIIVRSFRYLR